MTGRDELMLPPAVRRALVDHARDAAPRECCGFLVGRGRRVAFAVACTNVESGNLRYRIAPREHIDLRRVLRACSPVLEIIGVYHSHPDGPARPSPTDVAEALGDRWVHVIVGLASARAQVGAYRFGDRRIHSVAILSVLR